VTELRTDDTIKMIRETLCRAQSAISFRAAAGHDVDCHARDVQLLGRLIADCDRQRPLGPGGGHGDGERCTPTCGCERDHPGPPTGFMNWWTEGGPEALLQEAITHAQAGVPERPAVADEGQAVLDRCGVGRGARPAVDLRDQLG
jgi:hypothetical protein